MTSMPSLMKLRRPCLPLAARSRSRWAMLLAPRSGAETGMRSELQKGKGADGGALERARNLQEGMTAGKNTSKRAGESREAGEQLDFSRRTFNRGPRKAKTYLSPGNFAGELSVSSS